MQRGGSLVVAHGLSCPLACGIFVPRAAFEPVSPALEAWTPATGPAGRVPWSTLEFTLRAVPSVGFEKSVRTRVCRGCVIQSNRFAALNILCPPLIHLGSLPSPIPANPDPFTVSRALPFPERGVLGVTRCVNLPDWLLSFSSVLLRLLSALIDHFFFFFFLLEKCAFIGQQVTRGG